MQRGLSREQTGVRMVAAGRWLGVAVLCWLGGCAGSVVLDPNPPQGFRLDGEWLLDPLGSDPAPRRRALRQRGFSIAMAAQDFPVIRTRRMLIEESPDSVGIEYDGGVYRDLSWGVRRRGLWEVNAGWEEGRLLILSEAADARARETVTLSDGGRRMLVEVKLSAGGQTLEVVRVFIRQSR